MIIYCIIIFFSGCCLVSTLEAKKSILKLTSLIGEKPPMLPEDLFTEKNIEPSPPTAGEKEQRQMSEQTILEEQKTSQQAIENKPILQQSTEYKQIPLPGLPEYTSAKPAARISENQPDAYLQEQEYPPEEPPVDTQGLTVEEFTRKKEAEEVKKLTDAIDKILTQYAITIRDLTIGPKGVTQENYTKIIKFLEGLHNSLVQNSIFDVKDTILHAYGQWGASIELKNFGSKNSASAQAWGAMLERLRSQKLFE